jgi:hypothetical protein
MSQHHSRREVLKLLGTLPIAAASVSFGSGRAGAPKKTRSVSCLSSSAMGRHRRGHRDGRRRRDAGDRMDGSCRRAHSR